MDKIKQYYLITEAKPEYQTLILPFIKPSKKKIIFNKLELELQYINELGIYVDAELKVGGDDAKKIIVVTDFLF